MKNVFGTRRNIQNLVTPDGITRFRRQGGWWGVGGSMAASNWLGVVTPSRCFYAFACGCTTSLT